MLKGKYIYLRPWCNNDLPTLTALRNDAALQTQLLTRARGNSLEQVLEWLHNRSSNADSMLFIIAERSDDRAVGFIQVMDLELIDGHASLGICLVDSIRGKGVGYQAIKLLANYLRDYWRIRKLYLRVRSDNSVAIRCYEKVGFVRCGLLRKHIFIEGRWQEVVLMEIFLAEMI